MLTESDCHNPFQFPDTGFRGLDDKPNAMESLMLSRMTLLIFSKEYYYPSSNRNIFEAPEFVCTICLYLSYLFVREYSPLVFHRLRGQKIFVFKSESTI